jgi:surface antigen
VIETVPMRVAGTSRLYVNARALSGGMLSVSVSVLDDAAAAAASASAQAAAAERAPLIGDHRAWQGPTIAGGTVSLRFELAGQVDLFSFWLAPSRNEL